jgi:hypothetical protein
MEVAESAAGLLLLLLLLLLLPGLLIYKELDYSCIHHGLNRVTETENYIKNS